MSVSAEHLSAKQAAAWLGIATGTLRARVRDGSLPAPAVLGRRRLYQRSELEKALQELKERPVKKAE